MRECLIAFCTGTVFIDDSYILQPDNMIAIFYNVYKCTGGHIFHVCKKCGREMKYGSKIHIANCVIGLDLCGGCICTDKKLSKRQLLAAQNYQSFKNKQNVGISVRVYDLTKFIPQLMYINAKDFISSCDYDGTDIINNVDIFSRGILFIVLDEPILRRMFSPLKLCPVSCILCGMFYDSFPTMEVIATHLALRCAARV